MNHLVVGAIDFGTSYSGYAFSLKNTSASTVTERWMSGHCGLESEKTPTCILFDRTQTFKAFGYDAENKYAELSGNNEASDYFFFTNYKMTLYNKSVVPKDLMIKDILGRELPLIKVVSESLKYMKDKLLKKVKEQINIELSLEEDILFVLTVPAIWTDSAKSFMRDAAEMAGIPSQQLMICLEPEAAAIYCQSVPYMSLNTYHDLSPYQQCFQPGSKYIIVDAGGGTIDIAAHELDADNSLKEIHPACGGDGGGSSVDETFLDYLKQVYGIESFEEYKKNKPDDYLYLLREFEARKRALQVDSDENKMLQLRIPDSFHEIATSRTDLQNTPDESDINCVARDKMRIKQRKFQQFFDNSKHKIEQYVSQLLQNDTLNDIAAIILVGGYANSQLLQDFMKEKFNDKKVIVPHRAESAVLRGAVVFGHNPAVIAERRCRFTYGIQIDILFDKTVHKESTKYTDESGDIRARDCFDIHVKVGQNVKLGVFQKSRSYIPLRSSQEKIRFPLYTSKRNNPVYTDENDCDKIGEVNVDIRNLSGKLNEKYVNIALSFSNTEITVKAVKTQNGEELSSKIVYDW